AALAYGFAAGSVLLAIFFAPALISYAVRAQPPRKIAELILIAAAVAAGPVLVFLLWDPKTFVDTMSAIPADAWSNVERLRGNLFLEVPNYAIWHAALGGDLRFVQIGVAGGVIALS